MIIGRLETVGFKGSPRFEIWIDIKGCGRMGMVVLEVSDEDTELIRNRKKKVLSRMRHSGFVVLISIVELMFELLQLEYHCCGFIGYRCNYEGNIFNDVVDNILKRFSGIN